MGNRVQRMKIRAIVKGIISYIAAIGFSVIFGLFLNADVGWFILLTLILAPVISVFFAWLSSRMITLSCEMKDSLLSKGDTCTMTINVYNKSIFPTPPIELIFTEDVRVRGEDASVLVSVMPRAGKAFQIVFSAKICGKATVGVEKVRVTDYLGLFSFSVKKAEEASLKKNVSVIPDIAEISARDDNLVKVMQTSSNMEDSEDTIEASVTSFGGFPGYDNRDYVPGDPLKRINWKQSARRNKLLVRLDDELASKTVNVILDSVMDNRAVLFHDLAVIPSYRGCSESEIVARIAQDAVENALGIMRVLIQHNYTVNFYAVKGQQFVKYELEDESNLESVRLQLAGYEFKTAGTVLRLPVEETDFKDRVGMFSTPNPYEDAYMALEQEADAMYITIFSAVEEAKKQNMEEDVFSLADRSPLQKEKQSLKEKAVTVIKPLVIPFLLALLLSISIFTVFDTPVASYWTPAQMGMCIAILAFCEYVNRHRLAGTLFTVLLVVSCLRIFAGIAFTGDYGITYMQWFMSGGDSVETTFAYLFSLLVVFTVFFSMVVYYFAVVRYKTSYLLLVSMIPFVTYVKVMKDVDMTQVVFVTALNIAAFVVNTRTLRDKGKRMEGYISGLVSMGLYAALLILIGLSLPEAETKYYYLFENAFLGGNIREELPEEYSEMSDFSGNADAFNELNNRKLYEIDLVEPGTTMYLKRQTFDYYDFENDRWYPEDDYTQAVYSLEEWYEENEKHSLNLLIQAIHCAAEYEPEILSEYGLENIPDYSDAEKKQIYVDTMNFASVAYITPPYALRVAVQQNRNGDQENTFVSRAGVFRRKDGFLQDNIEYTVEYYDETKVQKAWIAAGGADFDSAASLEMLNRVKSVLYTNGQSEYAEVAESYIAEAEAVKQYREACEENNSMIPESVRELALEITKDCTYDWEKAQALQEYFRKNKFVYDLSYDAPDDSVEYFLFEGKTGTCSDYASAYVLMARAAGLTVRYAEGFIPREEYTTGEYLVRTNCGHAYPEVYIQNVGYVVYEATVPARYNPTRYGNSTLTYFLEAAIRVLLVFAVISAVVVSLLFIHLIAAPFVREAYFRRKFKKAAPGKAIVMLYKRIQQYHGKSATGNLGIYTPYEYAQSFEARMNYDISELSLMVEKAVYAENEINEEEKTRAWEIYLGTKDAIKEWKKQKK